MHRTWETVFHRDIQAHDVQQSIFDEIQGVWVDDETLSLVYDISSQLKQKN